ncbi:MAG: mechanosensitive ion channel family protein [Synergistaceae bacterium]|jgi:small conductance mechanosensitive channel|nr:mechanosensitive ion channel family protein [Synergistaceae bacterium]
MLSKFLVDGAMFWRFITGPVLVGLLWFALDYGLRKLYPKSGFLERVFVKHEKLQPFKRFLLIGTRFIVGVYFAFIMLTHLNINSTPIIEVNATWFWAFLTGPVLTAAIWAALDYALRKIYAKSTFIESLFVRNARVKTFKGLFLQMARVLLGIYFAFTMLGHFKIDPKPLLAGIGVVGLGLSLAAQNILRDFLNGLFIVIEDQFNVGDYVAISSNSGTVESFSMRETRLRATDGKLIIIPNGNISEVINSTKDFAVAIVDVGVSYDADIASVMEVLEECAAEVARRMPGVVVEESKVLGIMNFRESDILLRVMTRTFPGEQWGVERATRLVIKEKFDEHGIEIPYRQVVIHTETKKEPEAGARQICR